jgi:WD40 repeat protein
VSVFASLPRTTRGTPLVLGGDPKGKNFLYPNGNSIIIRDIDNPSICDIYTEHATLTTVAKYSPSGFYIASADQHGKIRVWDTTQKEHILKNEIQPFSGIVKDLAWSADSQRIVAVGEGRQRFGHVFSMDTGTSIGEISGHSKVINSCDFKPSRPFKIITGSEDTFVGIYEGPPFKFKSQLQDHNRFVQAIRFSPNGDLFASAGFDGKLFIYNSNDYSKVAELGSPAHKGGIYAISWSPDSKQLLSASGDKTCKLWDVSAATLLTEFTLGNDVPDQQVSCLWQEPHLLSVSLSGFINYLDRNNPGKPLRIIKGHNKSVTAMTVASCESSNDDEKTIFTGSHDGFVTHWNSKTGEHDRVEGVQHTNQVQDMYTLKDQVLTCGLDDTLRSIDLKTKQYSTSFSPIKLPVQPKGLVALSGTNVIVVAGVNELLVYDGQQQKSSLKIKYEASSVDVHPNQKDVAVGDASDKKVHVYSLEAGQLTEKKSLEHRGGVSAVKYSPDGKYLAAADANRKVVLYKSDDYSLAHDNEWGFHTAKVNCLAWAPNSKTLASGGLDTNLIVWFPDEPNKHHIIKHAHPQSQITRVAFLTDNRVVSTGQDATVRTWSIETK